MLYNVIERNSDNMVLEIDLKIDTFHIKIAHQILGESKLTFYTLLKLH